MLNTCLVYEGLYFDNRGFELSPAELYEKPKPFPVWNEAGQYVGEMVRVIRNADNCLEGLIEFSR